MVNGVIAALEPQVIDAFAAQLAGPQAEAGQNG
jgi:hypothetical protein